MPPCCLPPKPCSRRACCPSPSVTTINTDYNCLPFSITYGNGATDHYAYNGLSQRVYYQDGSGNTHYNGFDGASPGAALLSDSAAVYTPGLLPSQPFQP